MDTPNVLSPAGRAGRLVAWRPDRSGVSRARLEAGEEARVVSDTGERVVVSLPEGASGGLVLADM